MAELNAFNRFNEDLTQALETDALSVLTSGSTYEIEANLCQRNSGPVGQELQNEYLKWEKRNKLYIMGSGRAITDIGNRFLPSGGENARQEYFTGALQAVSTETAKRVANEMEGANVLNAIVPLAANCQYLSKLMREGTLDFENIPEESTALLKYIKHIAHP